MNVGLTAESSQENIAWYVIQTKPKKEGDVFAMLRRASFEIFLPQMKGVSSLKPLFPSYFFIHADLKEAQTHRLVHFTRGVRRILGDAEGPTPVADEVIATVKAVTKNGSVMERDLLFKEGDQVVVKKGILKDLQVIVEKKLSDQNRVLILYEWLNTTMRAKVEYKDIEAA
ncbi:MAG: hypothetical protein IPJ69_04700 [Deltaproteobacteria bacterium]|nr:MAG: hypothetical protein IPJ69_04700 [Deltaproteobacteria bacterium]